jgi:hypothetical protein
MVDLPVNPNWPHSPPHYADSNLIISAFGKLYYQGRDLQQTYNIIDAATDQERDVNYQLVDCSNPAARQYATTISCTDRRPPPFDNIWPGMEVTVSCAAPFCVVEGQQPGREYVCGSELLENGFMFYLPILYMMVRKISWNMREWRADTGWTFSLEESANPN